ncbi:hypothetical protein EOA51_33950, partial [Mesorhizobium sp. M1A.F.Ca.IN.020.32.1.1]|uniref:hypothetical protein n=1 Tax=Mesorhizobium sp. M1A.F.Ca.IN.020.32.1.1 TaxID=2496763 RepID=UPI000FD3F581
LVSNAGRTEIRLASFSATPKRVPLQLAAPATIAIENGIVRLGDLTILASDGTIVVAGTAGEELDISAQINALPATLINSFTPTLGAEGAIGGTVDVSGAAAAPVVGYDLVWNGASIASVRSAGIVAQDVT